MSHAPDWHLAANAGSQNSPHTGMVAKSDIGPAMLDWLGARRSHLALTLAEPGPDDAQLQRLITLASRVPDHGKLAPWRFLVFRGAAREAAGDMFARRAAAIHGPLDAARLQQEHTRFSRAPTVIGVISSPVANPKIPLWEQQLSAGASCMALLVGVHAMGFAGQWLSEWIAYDDAICRQFGLTPDEAIAGFIYIGTPSATPAERPRPAVADMLTYWQPS